MLAFLPPLLLITFLSLSSFILYATACEYGPDILELWTASEQPVIATENKNQKRMQTTSYAPIRDLLPEHNLEVEKSNTLPYPAFIWAGTIHVAAA